MMQQMSFGMLMAQPGQTRAHLAVATKHLARAAEMFERVESDLELLALRLGDDGSTYESIRSAANGACEAACYTRQAVECLGETCGSLNEVQW